MSDRFQTSRRRGPDVVVPITERIKKTFTDPLKKKFEYVRKLFHDHAIEPYWWKNIEWWGMIFIPLLIVALTWVVFMVLLLWNPYTTTWGLILGAVYALGSLWHFFIFIVRYGVSGGKYFEKTASHHVISRMVFYFLGTFGLALIALVLIVVAIDTDNLTFVAAQLVPIEMLREHTKQISSLLFAMIVSGMYVCSSLVSSGTHMAPQHHDKHPRMDVDSTPSRRSQKKKQKGGQNY